MIMYCEGERAGQEAFMDCFSALPNFRLNDLFRMF